MVILGTMDEKGGGKEEEKGMIRRTISDDRVYYKTLSRNIFFFFSSGIDSIVHAFIHGKRNDRIEERIRNEYGYYRGGNKNKGFI